MTPDRNPASTSRLSLRGRVALAMVATFAGAALLGGAEAQLGFPSKTTMEISGGSGAKAWTIRYGTAELHQKRFVNADGSRAWLSHGGWLRLVDTDKGLIL